MEPLIPVHADDMSDWFWSIIQQANKDRDKLKSILQRLPDDEVRRFAVEFMHAADNLRQPPYLEYYRVGQGKSEDDVADMTYWMVSQGKEFYTTVLNHPEVVSAYEAAEAADSPELDSLEFVAEGVLNDRQGEWPDDIVEEYGQFLASGYAHVSDYWETRQAQEE